MIPPRPPGLREYNLARRHLRLVAPEPTAPTSVPTPTPAPAPPMRSSCAHCVDRAPSEVRRKTGRELHLCGGCAHAFDTGGLAFTPDPLWEAARNRSIA